MTTYSIIKNILSKLLDKSKIKHLFVIGTNASDGLTKSFNRTVANEISIVNDSSDNSYFACVTVDGTSKKIVGSNFIGNSLDYLYELNDVYINPDEGAPIYYNGYFLKYNGTNWITQQPVTAALSNFNGVLLNSLQNDDCLMYNGMNWINQQYTTPTINLSLETSFSDVVISNKIVGQVLQTTDISGTIKYKNTTISFEQSEIFNKLSLIYKPFSLSIAMHSVPNILYPTINTWTTSGTTTVNAYAFYFISQYSGQLSTMEFIVGNGKSNFTSRAYFRIGIKIVSGGTTLTTSSITYQNISGMPGEKIVLTVPTPYNAVKNQTFWVILQFLTPSAPIGIGPSDSGCLLGAKVTTDSSQPNFSSVYVNSGGGSSLTTYPANGSYIPYFELY